jgi:hypothetical protein
MGIGLIRKALFIATFGLSGLVFKEPAKKERTAKAGEKPAAAKKQPKAKAAKARSSQRRKARTARTSATAKTVASSNGATTELERLAKLHRQGALSDEEFAAAKIKILGARVKTEDASPRPAQPSATPDRSSLAPERPERGHGTFDAVEANVAAARHLADLGVPDLTIHDRRPSIAPVSSD